MHHCTFEIGDGYCRTAFADGTSVYAEPENTLDYKARAHDLGYGRDTLRMCIEHEFLHSVLAEAMSDKPSQALWDTAHGLTADRGWEERAVMTIQKRINELRNIAAPGCE